MNRQLHYLDMETKEPDQRPKFLNLLKIRLPIGAVVSIAHRFSGLVLFLIIPFLIYMLEISLKTEQGFQQVAGLLDRADVRIGLVLILWMLFHHLFNGIRLLLVDIDIGITRTASRRNSWLVIFAGLVVLAFMAGALL